MAALNALPAVILLDFDPWLHVGSAQLRWEAVALSVIIAVSLACFRLLVERIIGPVPTEDMVFVVLGVLPGAAVGGRLVHGVDFLAAYSSDPSALLDLGRGSLSLVGAVAGGVLTGWYVCRLLGYPASRWLDAAAVPLILAIGLGKMAMVLGGAGQGSATSADFATAYVGTGWVSADATVAAYPAQVYEGVWTIVGAGLLILLTGRRTERWLGGGRRFLAAICWWLAGRLLLGFLWRDERVLGPLGAEQLATLVLLLTAIVTLPVLSLVRSRRQRTTAARIGAS